MIRIPRSTRPRLFLILLLLLTAVLPAAAQTPTGSIEGVVVDASGAVVPGVTVVVTQEPRGPCGRS